MFQCKELNLSHFCSATHGTPHFQCLTMKEMFLSYCSALTCADISLIFSVVSKCDFFSSGISNRNNYTRNSGKN
jgi:hypothetical protein